MGLVSHPFFFDIQLIALVFTRWYACEIRVFYCMTFTQLTGLAILWPLLLVGLSEAEELVLTA